MKNLYYLVLFIFCFYGDLQAQKIQLLQQDTATSIRGLSVVNDQVAWVSGSRGHVGISLNGGTTWKWQQVKGFEKSDFRDVEAFSTTEAIIMSSGTPALILKTTDAGESWKVVYRNDDKAYFLDAMDFRNSKTGYVLGDPIDRSFLLLQTVDGGNNWKAVPNLPYALPGEAAFAASGTCLQVSENAIKIVTGGSVAHLIFKSLKEEMWHEVELPIRHGLQSQGAFSIASGLNSIVIVGGDYVKKAENDSVAVRSDQNLYHLNLKVLNNGPAGFQSCVTYLKDSIFLTTGTSGSNLTTNGGLTWQQIDALSFNICQKAKHGNLVLLAGDKGKIARFVNH